MRLHRRHVLVRRLPHIFAGMVVVALLTAGAAPLFISSSANAALLEMRSVQLSDPTAGAADVAYKFGFTTSTGASIGSIKFTICSNYLYEPTDTCTPPSGFDASAATLTASSGVTDFTLVPPASPNALILSRPVAAPVSPQPLTYDFADIVNPNYIGSFYVRITTHTSLDASDAEVDFGNVVFGTTLDITITTEVPPYLLFCVGLTIEGFNCGTAEGGVLNFGELSARQTRTATSQMLASTNAAFGYSVTMAGNTMTAGNNVIPAMNGGPSVLGTSQFGLNARANSSPAVGAEPFGPGLTMPAAQYNAPNNFRFKSGEIIASSGTTDDYRKLTVSYIVNRSVSQEPGRYVATISYICLANF